VAAARRVAEALQDVAAERNLAVGLGVARRGEAGVRRGLREAEDAARIGDSVIEGGCVLLYRDAGAYRYLIHLLHSTRPSDHLSELANRLGEYDRERSTRLLQTLDVFLAEGRSIAGAARELWIHPNTLRQRLERIESLTGATLADEDLLALHLAVKLARGRSGEGLELRGGQSAPPSSPR